MSQSISQPEKRNVILNGRRTTLQLERYIWENTSLIATRTNQPLQDILCEVWKNKGHMAMAPAVRLFLMLYFTNYADTMSKAVEEAIQPNPHSITAAEASPDSALMCYHHAMGRLQAIAS